MENGFFIFRAVHTGDISQMSFPTTMLTARQVEEMSAMATAEGFMPQLSDKVSFKFLWLYWHVALHNDCTKGTQRSLAGVGFSAPHGALKFGLCQREH